MVRINENSIVKSYTMKHGEIKFCKFDDDADAGVADATGHTTDNRKFYITNDNPDDVPLVLTVEETNQIFKMIQPLQRVAKVKQDVIDSYPIPSDCDEIDGPRAPHLYSQRILMLYGGICGFVRALIWIVGRRVKLTIETNYCSYKDTKKLVAETGTIEVDLYENLEMIKNFLQECE